MIEPLHKGEAYPARLPPVRTQWRRVPRPGRLAIVGGPLVVVAALFAADGRAGVVGAVMVGGVGAASALYVKNKTDRHNAAVDRGEIPVVDDPHLQAATMMALPSDMLDRLATLGYPAADIGEVTAFVGGWIVKRRNRHDVSVVVGDDGGHAFFDPRWVDDLRAAAEYRAGRGREPAPPADGA
jgi:hypothetical protein